MLLVALLLDRTAAPGGAGGARRCIIKRAASLRGDVVGVALAAMPGGASAGLGELGRKRRRRSRAVPLAARCMALDGAVIGYIPDECTGADLTYDGDQEWRALSFISLGVVWLWPLVSCAFD